jgi:hypothetical protein
VQIGGVWREQDTGPVFKKKAYCLSDIYTFFAPDALSGKTIMKKALKITGLVAACIVAWGLIAYSGLYAFTRLVYHQRTCAWANIDNVELHARLDIPLISSCDCTYDAVDNSKRTVFHIDKERVDLDNYIRQNGFKQLTSNVVLDSLLEGEANLARDQGASAAIYYTMGAQGAKNWQALLNKSSGVLLVLIRYAE